MDTVCASQTSNVAGQALDQWRAHPNGFQMVEPAVGGGGYLLFIPQFAEDICTTEQVLPLFPQDLFAVRVVQRVHTGCSTKPLEEHLCCFLLMS